PSIAFRSRGRSVRPQARRDFACRMAAVSGTSHPEAPPVERPPALLPPRRGPCHRALILFSRLAGDRLRCGHRGGSAPGGPPGDGPRRCLPVAPGAFAVPPLPPCPPPFLPWRPAFCGLVP